MNKLEQIYYDYIIKLYDDYYVDVTPDLDDMAKIISRLFEKQELANPIELVHFFIKDRESK